MYNNGMCGNNCLWIIILLILFCGCGNNGICGGSPFSGGNGCGCGNGNGCNCGCNHDCCC